MLGRRGFLVSLKSLTPNSPAFNPIEGLKTKLQPAQLVELINVERSRSPCFLICVILVVRGFNVNDMLWRPLAAWPC